MVTVIFSHGRERNIAFAIFGVIAGTGAAFGLLLGGVLIEYVDWRWCLLVNVVFVVIALIGGALLLDESRAEGDNRYDLLGTLIIALALASLVYGFARAEHGWGDTATLGFIAVGAVLLVAFVWTQTRVANPLLPLRVVLHRVRAAAFLLQAVVGVVMMGAMLYLTFHFQVVMGMSPVQAGLANVAMTAVIMVTAPLSTKAFNNLGARAVLVTGPLLGAVGLFLLGGVTADGSYVGEILPGLVVLGLGLSLIFVPMQNLALAGVEPQDAGVASALANSSLHIGGSIAVAVFTALYTSSADASVAAGATPMEAVADGYAPTFTAAGVVMLVGAALAGTLIKGGKPAPMVIEEAELDPVLSST